MKKITALSFLLLLFAARNNAENFNPTGYCGHVSLGLNILWINKESVYLIQYDETLDNYSFTETDTQNSRAFSLEINIPYNRGITFSNTYSVQDIHGTLFHTDCFGLIIFSKETKQLSDLKNPDGANKSFVLGPLMGINIWQEKSRYNDVLNHGIIAGLQVSYIATDHLTLNSGYLFSQLGNLNSKTAIAGFKFHANTKEMNEKSFNPDGHPGTISFSPQIGYVTSNDGIYGFTTGLSMAVPVSRKLSMYFIYQYDRLKEDRESNVTFRILQKSLSSDLGFGLNIYF